MGTSEILSLVPKLGWLLIEEANYLLQVKPEVESLHKELELMTTYLKDADAIQHKSDRAKVWIRQLSELVFEVEDAIDVFVYESVRKRRESVVRKIIKSPKFLVDAHMLRGKIIDIKGKIKNLSDDRMKYDIQPLQEGQTSAQAYQGQASGMKAIPHVNIVGIQSEAEELAKLLMKEEPLGQFGVVSITGMGGLGKTTLAQKIFSRNDVKRHFDCHAWVYVSKEFRMRDILYDIIKQVMVLTEAEKKAFVSEEAKILEGRLSDFLREKKNYLFVLDDVWRKEDWDELKCNLPDPFDSQQCRVLLTTRDDGVARHAEPIADPYKLQLLDEEKSLKLFSKVFFRSQNDADAEARLNSLNKEMKDLATNIVKKCDGLPLAIVVLGGLLSDKRLNTVAEWKKVLDGVKWHLDSSSKYQKVLALSYTELPYHLKCCFLYFGIFPEDTEIDRERLIRLWVAEGILEPRDNLTMEDVGGECLEELMQRNMIQVAEWKSNGVPKSFIVHDLLLNLAISEAKEGNFINITSSEESLKCSRRVALRRHNFSEDTKAVSSSHSSSLSSTNLLRSLLCFAQMSPSLYGQFKLLNVLDLEDAPWIESLPKEIGKLIFLKYLSLRGNKYLKTLPPWVGNLGNLQTLDLYDTKIESVPVEIFKLDKLRHLICFNMDSGSTSTSDDFIVQSAIGGVYGRYPSPKPCIYQLRDLQTLWLHTGNWIEDGLETLTNLRVLGLKGFGGRLMDKSKEALSQALVRLERLEILVLSEQEWPGLRRIFLPSFSGHVYLYDITLSGAIEKLPDLNNFPPNLTRLELTLSFLKEDMMVTLEKLPDLKDLTLGWMAYFGEMMKCSVGGFPKLENLTLAGFDLLTVWIVEEGAMPNLRRLEMNRLYRLTSLPDGLRYITTLQKLTLAMPKEFLGRVKEGGKDWEKIKNVPSIITQDLY